MKKLLSIVFMLYFSLITSTYAQGIREYVEGKFYKNQQTGRSIKFGYISSLNTSGITFKDSDGN